MSMWLRERVLRGGQEVTGFLVRRSKWCCIQSECRKETMTIRTIRLRGGQGGLGLWEKSYSYEDYGTGERLESKLALSDTIGKQDVA